MTKRNFKDGLRTKRRLKYGVCCIQAFKVLKNSVHAEAKRESSKNGYLVVLLTKTRFILRYYQLILCMFGFLH